MTVQDIASPLQTIPAQRNPRRWLMLIIVLLATLMDGIDNFIVNVAIPSIQHELHASFAEVQLVAAGYILSFAVLLVTGGRLGDLYGRKLFFVLGTAGFTLFSALCGFATSSPLLIVCRIAQGACAALMAPQVLSFIQFSFNERERSFAFGCYTAVGGIAASVGQASGGFLLAANLFGLGWRSIFLINVPVGILAVLAAWPLIRESRAQDAQELDYGGVGLLTLTLFLLVFPLVMGGSTGWPLWSFLCLLLVVPCLISFLAYEQRLAKRGRTPLISLDLFRQRAFSKGTFANGLAFALFASMMFLLAFYLQTMLRLTPLQAGLMFLSSSIPFLITSGTSPIVASHLSKRTLPVSALLITLGYMLLLLAARFFVPLWGVFPILVALLVHASGSGLLMTPLMDKTLSKIAEAQTGVASGIYVTMMQVSSALGVAVIGLLFALLTTDIGNALSAFVVSVLIIALLSLMIWLTVRALR